MLRLSGIVLREGRCPPQGPAVHKEKRNQYSMDQFMNILTVIDNHIWGIPLCVLIIGCGIWLTLRVRLLQLRHLGRALKYMVQNESGGEGEVTSFGALCTALSATIGTGNIVGVATAIAAGHPRFIPVSLPAVLSYTVCREGLTHSRGRRKKTETGYISLFSRTSQ